MTVPAEPGPLYDDGNGAVLALLKKGNIYTYMSWFHDDKWTALIHEPGAQHGSGHGFIFATHPGRLALGLETFRLEPLNDQRQVISLPTKHGPADSFNYEGNRVLNLSKEETDSVKFVRITHRKHFRRVIFPHHATLAPATPPEWGFARYQGSLCQRESPFILGMVCERTRSV